MPDAAATAEAVAATLAAIRARAPLVHNITNFVVTNSTANALLALGASPAMVEGAEEVAEFAVRADALVINLGTMSAPRAASIRLAVAAAGQAGVPWVLDPVAAGAITARTALARELLAARPAVVRGNASEILALAGEGGGGRGVDSTATAAAGLDAALLLAARAGVVAAVTGAVDHVTDGRRSIAIHNGHPMMTRVDGTRLHRHRADRRLPRGHARPAGRRRAWAGDDRRGGGDRGGTGARAGIVAGGDHRRAVRAGCGDAGAAGAAGA